MGFWRPRERRTSVSRRNQRKSWSQQARVEEQRKERDRKRTARREQSSQRHTVAGIRDARRSAVGALLSTLAAADHRAATWCAVSCARTVHAPPVTHRCGRLLPLDQAVAWVEGAGTVEECRQAARDAADDAHQFDQPWRFDLAAACAHRAAASACAAWRSTAAAEAAAWAAAAHAAAVASDQPLYSAAWRDRWAAGFDEHLERLLALVSAARWPQVAPTGEQIRSAPPAVAVAWDRLVEVRGGVREEQTVPALVEAHALAELAGLAWAEPLQRALAEQAVAGRADPEWLRRVLR